MSTLLLTQKKISITSIAKSFNGVGLELVCMNGEKQNKTVSVGFRMTKDRTAELRRYCNSQCFWTSETVNELLDEIERLRKVADAHIDDAQALKHSLKMAHKREVALRALVEEAIPEIQELRHRYGFSTNKPLDYIGHCNRLDAWLERAKETLNGT